MGSRAHCEIRPLARGRLFGAPFPFFAIAAVVLIVALMHVSVHMRHKQPFGPLAAHADAEAAASPGVCALLCDERVAAPSHASCRSPQPRLVSHESTTRVL